MIRSAIDGFLPGPADGRNGGLRQQILELELKKRDRNLRELFELEKGSPAPSAWVGLGTIAYEIVTHFRPQRIVELGSFGGFSTCVMGLALRDLNQGGQVYAVARLRELPQGATQTWFGHHNCTSQNDF
jgi:predicted O-methyltransferase YrrM